MLVKERLLFIKADEHEFEELLDDIKDSYELRCCSYDQSTVINSMEMEADHVICSLRGIKENNFWNILPLLPKPVVLYKEPVIDKIQYLNDNNICCLYMGNGEKESNRHLVKMICCDVPYRFMEFRQKIVDIIYSAFVINGCKHFEGMMMITTAVEHIFFSENRTVMSSGEIYRYISEKSGVSPAAAEMAVRRSIGYIWKHKDIYGKSELLAEILKSKRVPSNTKLLYSVADKLFFDYRIDFCRYYAAQKESEAKE